MDPMKNTRKLLNIKKKEVECDNNIPYKLYE